MKKKGLKGAYHLAERMKKQKCRFSLYGKF